MLIQRFGGLEKASEEFAKDPEVLTSVSAIYLSDENRLLYYSCYTDNNKKKTKKELGEAGN